MMGIRVVKVMVVEVVVTGRFLMVVEVRTDSQCCLGRYDNGEGPLDPYIF